MRRVRKQACTLFHLEQAHANPPADAANASSRWSSFAHKARVLNEYLLEEQYGLCCYSEVRADQLGLGFHIEHVENKSQNPLRTFDFANLAASAFDSADGQQRAAVQGWEVFGGHASGKAGAHGAVDMQRFVSPHAPGCARFFVFLSTGEIAARSHLGPVDHDRAEYTIRLLNLNSPFLVSLRQVWWDELDDFLNEHLASDWDIDQLIRVCLLPTGGRLERFFSLSRQFFGAQAQRILLAEAPELL